MTPMLNELRNLKACRAAFDEAEIALNQAYRQYDHAIAAKFDEINAENALGYARRMYERAARERAEARIAFDKIIEELTRTGGERRKPSTQGAAPSERRSQESAPP